MVADPRGREAASNLGESTKIFKSSAQLLGLDEIKALRELHIDIRAKFEKFYSNPKLQNSIKTALNNAILLMEGNPEYSEAVQVLKELRAELMAYTPKISRRTDSNSEEHAPASKSLVQSEIDKRKVSYACLGQASSVLHDKLLESIKNKEIDPLLKDEGNQEARRDYNRMVSDISNLGNQLQEELVYLSSKLPQTP